MNMSYLNLFVNAESKSTKRNKTNSGTAPSTPDMNEEIKFSSNLRKFSFIELKDVTRNFRTDSILGEGGFGCVFKGWLNQNAITGAKAGMGIPVAVKTLNHDGLQGHREWLVCDLINPNYVSLHASYLFSLLFLTAKCYHLHLLVHLIRLRETSVLCFITMAG